jgi:hypothetical protein
MHALPHRIRNVASGKLLANPEGSRTNGTEIIQWDETGGVEQAWSLERGSHGGIVIRNMASRKLLADPQGARENGTKVIQWDDTGGVEQEWMFDPPL